MMIWRRCVLLGLSFTVLAACRSPNSAGSKVYDSAGADAPEDAASAGVDLIVDMTDPDRGSFEASFTEARPRVYVRLKVPAADPPLFVVQANGTVTRSDGKYEPLAIEMSLFGAPNQGRSPLRGLNIEVQEPGGGTVFQGELAPGIWYVELWEKNGKFGTFRLAAFR